MFLKLQFKKKKDEDLKMAQLKWNVADKKTFKHGISKTVLFVQNMASDAATPYKEGVAWQGVSNITSKPSGAEPSPFFADNVKYLNLLSVEDYAASISCYDFPDEFDECLGWKKLESGLKVSQQERVPFGLIWRNEIGKNQNQFDDYEIHVVYNGLAGTSEESVDTLNDSPAPGTMTYEISTTPEEMTDMKPTAHFSFVASDCDPTQLRALEDVIYGTADTGSRLPLPAELATLLTKTSG